MGRPLRVLPEVSLTGVAHAQSRRSAASLKSVAGLEWSLESSLERKCRSDVLSEVSVRSTVEKFCPVAQRCCSEVSLRSRSETGLCDQGVYPHFCDTWISPLYMGGWSLGGFLLSEVVISHSPEQKCCSEVLLASVALKCLKCLSIRSVAQICVCECGSNCRSGVLPRRSLHACVCLCKLLLEVLLRSVAYVGVGVSICWSRSVAQKCPSDVSIRTVARKCCSEVSCRSVDQNCW